MDCSTFREQLDDLKAGRLEPAVERELAAHRNACAGCARVARRYARPPRLVAAGFIGAFAASVLTLIYTGLSVRGTDDVDEAARTATSVPAGSERSLDRAAAEALETEPEPEERRREADARE